MNPDTDPTIYKARAGQLLAQSRHAQAIDELQRYLTHDPDDASAHAMMAIAYARASQPKEALTWANRAVQLGPDDGFCHFARALSLRAGNKIREAEDAALEAVRLDPLEPDFFMTLGQIRYLRQNWTGALQAAEAGLALDAAHSGCINVRAMTLLRQGKKDHADAAIQSALSQDPENAVTHTNQGWICLGRGERDRAMEHFREALRLDPNIDQARMGVLEVLRTKYAIYRMLYAYFEWMAGFNGVARRGIVVGAWVLVRFFAFTTVNAVKIPVLLAYGFFVFLTWTGRSTFDLLIRLNPLGRLALSRQQIVASNWVGLCLGSALISVSLYFIQNRDIPLVAAFCYVLLAIPASKIARSGLSFRSANIAFGAIYLTIVGTEAVGLSMGLATDLPLICLILFSFCGIAYTWVAGMKRQ